MKIVAPLNRLNEIEGLISAGADELYCGLIDQTQWQEYASSACLNRRENIFSNLNNLTELKQAIQIAHRHSVPLILTLNEFYNENQSLAVMRQAEEALNCGVDALLVADLGLILMLRDKFKKIKLYLSSCATVFNSRAIELYAEFGISRIILHRHLNIEEIKALKDSAPGELNMEAFVLNEKCYNLDGYCSFQHGNLANINNCNQQSFLTRIIKKYVRFFPQGVLQLINRHMVRNSHACCFPFHTKGINKEENRIIFNTAQTFLYACGICNIYDFYKLGISHVKIAGRSILTDQINNVALLKEVINLLDDKISKQDFIFKAKNIVRSRYRKCASDHCYYFSE